MGTITFWLLKWVLPAGSSVFIERRHGDTLSHSDTVGRGHWQAFAYRTTLDLSRELYTAHLAALPEVKHLGRSQSLDSPLTPSEDTAITDAG